GNAAASLTSKASDFILSTTRQQSVAEGVCANRLKNSVFCVPCGRTRRRIYHRQKEKGFRRR
ncbi:MAG: hypothetical protein MJ101_07630, partial [Clostridia bacterium]|nr:hypothetical protein [Clostridia bacterium]